MKKKIKKKIIIIGGGIIGCVLSSLLSKNGHKVEIYDYRKKLGGILGDFEKKDLKFLRGCQYINKNSLTHKFIDQYSNKFKIIKHEYSSYTNFFNEEFFSKKYAVPVFKSNILKLRKFRVITHIKKRKSLKDRLNLYPNFVKKNLYSFFKNLNLNIKNICYENYYNFQMGRIAFPGFELQLERLKKTSKFFDELYAVEKNRLNFKKFNHALLPKKGYDEFFKEFENKSVKNKIKIFKSCNVTFAWRNKKLEIFSKDKKIENDYVIWTGNPVKLINNYLKTKLESPPFKVLQISADLKNNDIKENYIQVYSDKLEILRIFIYKFNKINKINIESSLNRYELNKKKVLIDAKKILKKLGIFINYNPQTISSFRDIRFNNITVKDKIIINEFNKKTKKTNLINSSWLEYGREEKLSCIVRELRRLNLVR